MASCKKNSIKQNATIVFVDESGFSLIPSINRTWAPKGNTPILRHSLRWSKFSAISAITTGGQLLFMAEMGTIRAPQCAKFLKHLLRHIPGKIILIWDNFKPHKSKDVMKVVEGSKGRIEIEYLPPYAPELNPDEGIWMHLKTNELANYCPKNIEELKSAVRLAVVRTRRRADLIFNILQSTPLLMDGLLS